jgi:hypothetical protein
MDLAFEALALQNITVFTTSAEKLPLSGPQLQRVLMYIAKKRPPVAEYKLRQKVFARTEKRN